MLLARMTINTPRISINIFIHGGAFVYSCAPKNVRVPLGAEHEHRKCASANFRRVCVELSYLCEA